jgi:hypothetical protein
VTDTVGRVLKTVAPGSASTSNRFEDDRPLSSGVTQLLLASNLNHLAAESAYRMVATIPGFDDIQSGPALSSISSPNIATFDWRPRYGGISPAPTSQCLGSHLIHRRGTIEPSTALWPKAVLRGRVETPSSGLDYIGAILVVTAGRTATPTGGKYHALNVPGTGWKDLRLEVQLDDTTVAPIADAPMLGAPASGVPGIAEPLVGYVSTFWCAFYTTAGKVQAVALTLSLEP